MPENQTSEASTPERLARRGRMTSKSRADVESAPKPIRLDNIVIENFKAIDNLVIRFPMPSLPGDPDVFVMGSKNGLGKTSVLEACALLIVAAITGEKTLSVERWAETPLDLSDLLVRAGASESLITGTFAVGDETTRIEMHLTRQGKVQIIGGPGMLRDALGRREATRMSESYALEWLILSLAGLSSEPLMLAPVMYFNSFRKIQEGSTELGTMIEGAQAYRRSRLRPGVPFPISTFKQVVLRAMMGRGRLFEGLDDDSYPQVLDTLNNLMSEYARGRIEKLRPSQESTLEFRVTPVDGGEPFGFDGLSSGQKEIISTLFLIWHYSRTQPSIVLIDEPELHLNPEWHHRFIRRLHALAPQNQYIIATHSEEVFSSVERDRRILLRLSA